MTSALFAGWSIGLLVALQLGPISLLIVRATLRISIASAAAIAVGVASVDVCYATCGALGAGRLLDSHPGLRLALGLAGIAVLASMGLKTMWSALRIRLGAEADEEVLSPAGALLTGLLVTASNPLTILSWAAVFAAASFDRSLAGGTPWFLLGIGCGSLTSDGALIAVTASLRRRLTARMLQWADAAAGAGILGFASVLAWRTLRAES
jgi:putative LysE/RhtB family amino acid efflux pump